MVDYLGQLEGSGFGGARALKELGGAVVVGRSHPFDYQNRALIVLRQHFKPHFLTAHITLACMVWSFQ